MDGLYRNSGSERQSDIWNNVAFSHRSGPAASGLRDHQINRFFQYFQADGHNSLLKSGTGLAGLFRRCRLVAVLTLLTANRWGHSVSDRVPPTLVGLADSNASNASSPFPQPTPLPKAVDLTLVTILQLCVCRRDRRIGRGHSRCRNQSVTIDRTGGVKQSDSAMATEEQRKSAAISILTSGRQHVSPATRDLYVRCPPERGSCASRRPTPI